MILDDDKTVLKNSLEYIEKIRKHYEKLCYNDYKQLQNYYIEHRKIYHTDFVRTLIDRVLVPKEFSNFIVWNILADVTYPVREDLAQKYVEKILKEFDCEITFPNESNTYNLSDRNT